MFRELGKQEFGRQVLPTCIRYMINSELNATRPIQKVSQSDVTQTALLVE